MIFLYPYKTDSFTMAKEPSLSHYFTHGRVYVVEERKNWCMLFRKAITQNETVVPPT